MSQFRSSGFTLAPVNYFEAFDSRKVSGITGNDRDTPSQGGCSDEDVHHAGSRPLRMEDRAPSGGEWRENFRT